MAKKRGVAMVLMSLVLGAGFGATVGGCGDDEDRGSVEIEGGTTGTGTVGTTTTPTATETTDDSSGSGY
jgi:hypothetical protein